MTSVEAHQARAYHQNKILPESIPWITTVYSPPWTFPPLPPRPPKSDKYFLLSLLIITWYDTVEPRFLKALTLQTSLILINSKLFKMLLTILMNNLFVTELNEYNIFITCWPLVPRSFCSLFKRWHFYRWCRVCRPPTSIRHLKSTASNWLWKMAKKLSTKQYKSIVN